MIGARLFAAAAVLVSLLGPARAADLPRHGAVMLDTITPAVPRGFAADLPRSPLVDAFVDGNLRFTSLAEARQRCRGDDVVRVDPWATAYRPAEATDPPGSFMCKAAALGEGDLPR